MTEPTSVSPPHRYPGGQKKPDGREPRHPNARTYWKRFHRTDWYSMMQRGEDPNWGTVPGMMFLDGVLSETQADGCKLYASISAKYDRYHGIGRRSAKSPAYELSFGSDDEVEKHRQHGTLSAYEGKAKSWRRKWTRMLNQIPAHLTQAFEDVCIDDKEIHQSLHEEFARVAGKIARYFGVLEDARVKNDRKMRQLSSKKKLDVITGAMHSVENWFKEQPGDPKPTLFKVLTEAPEGERGLAVYGECTSGEWVRHTVTVKAGKTFLEAELDSLLLRAAEQRGWKERPHD